MKRNMLSVRTFSDQYLGDRSNQEDALLISSEKMAATNGLLVVVSDGMGGMERGEVYSQSAVETMQEAFAQLSAVESISLCDTLQSVYKAARAAALRLRNTPDDADGGATVVAALIKNGKCAVLSVGDSRIYLLRNGGLIQLNREQTLGVMLDERAAFGVIPKEVATHNPHRGSLMNHTNAEQEMECDICSTPFAIRPGDKIALMSDGVFGTLSDDELTQCLRLPGREAVQSIMDRIRMIAKPKQDNATVALIEIE